MPFKLWPPRRTDPVSEANKRLEENPRDVFALMDRAEAFLGRRDAKSALRDIERGLQIALLEPKLRGDARSVLLSRLYTMQSRAFLGLGDHAKSIRDCRQALELNPYHFAAASGMGQAYLKLGNPVSALESFRRALRLNPGLDGVRAQVVRLTRMIEDK